MRTGRVARLAKSDEQRSSLGIGEIFHLDREGSGPIRMYEDIELKEASTARQVRVRGGALIEVKKLPGRRKLRCATSQGEGTALFILAVPRMSSRAHSNPFIDDEAVEDPAADEEEEVDQREDSAPSRARHQFRLTKEHQRVIQQYWESTPQFQRQCSDHPTKISIPSGLKALLPAEVNNRQICRVVRKLLALQKAGVVSFKSDVLISLLTSSP